MAVQLSYIITGVDVLSMSSDSSGICWLQLIPSQANDDLSITASRAIISYTMNIINHIIPCNCHWVQYSVYYINNEILLQKSGWEVSGGFRFYAYVGRFGGENYQKGKEAMDISGYQTLSISIPTSLGFVLWLGRCPWHVLGANTSR